MPRLMQMLFCFPTKISASQRKRRNNKRYLAVVRHILTFAILKHYKIWQEQLQ